MTRFLLILLLLGTTPGWAQVQPAATGGGDDDERMMMPAPVSGEHYPMSGRAEARSNFISAGLGFIAAYNDNVFAGGNAKPVREETYSILPNLRLDVTTPRQRRSLEYSAGFIFYQPTSSLNSVQQSADASFRYRMSPRTTFTVGDTFQQSSNPFNQASFNSGIPITGSPETPTTFAIAPYAEQQSNSGNIGLSYQFGRNGMIGASGSTSLLNYPNLSQAEGLNDFISGEGSGYLIRRLTPAQYLGGVFRYSNVMTRPFDTTTDSQTISILYTIFFRRNVSASVTAGPQHYNATQNGVITSTAWTPSVSASLGWQREHGTFSGKYSRYVSGGGGLLGTYYADSAGADAEWQFERTWSAGASGSYMRTKNVTPLEVSSNPGGHTLIGTVSIQHPIGERVNTALGYARLNQSYNGINAVSTAPNSDRVFFTLTYEFSKPLGR
jgi:hypothetical protein